MSILDTAKSNFSRWLYNQISPHLDYATPSGVVSGLTYPGATMNVWAGWDHEAYERLGATSPLVKPNIDLIGNGVARAIGEVQKPNLEDKEKWDPVDHHRLDYILNTRPFTDVGATWAWKYQVMWLMLRGEAYWMMVPNRMGELKYMVPLPAYMLKPIPWKEGMGGEERLIGYYAYTPNDPQYPQAIDPAYICYHRLPNPFDPIRGLSLVSVYLMMLKTVTEADKFDLDDYLHGLTLSKLISLRSELSERDYAKAVNDWERSSAKADRFRIIRGGDASVSDIATRRGETGETVHKRAKEYADRVWGIPEGMRDKNATEASAKVAKAVYLSETLQPLLDMLQEDINAQVVSGFYSREGIRWQFQSVVPEDLDEQLKRDEAERGPKTYDEVRAEKGLPPHPISVIGNAPYHSAGQVAASYTRWQVTAAKEQLSEQEKAVKAKGQPFIPLGADKPMLPAMLEGQITKLAQREVDDYITEFYARNPDLEGLLDATTYTNGQS